MGSSQSSNLFLSHFSLNFYPCLFSCALQCQRATEQCPFFIAFFLFVCLLNVVFLKKLSSLRVLHLLIVILKGKIFYKVLY